MIGTTGLIFKKNGKLAFFGLFLFPDCFEMYRTNFSSQSQGGTIITHLLTMSPSLCDEINLQFGENHYGRDIVQK